MSFKLRSRKKGAVPILEIIGEFTGEHIYKVSHKLDSLRKGCSGEVAIDLGGVTFIDSHGLGVFVYCWRLLEKENRKLVFINPQGFILSMFEGTNLDKIFRIVESEEQI